MTGLSNGLLPPATCGKPTGKSDRVAAVDSKKSGAFGDRMADLDGATGSAFLLEFAMAYANLNRAHSML